MTDDLIEQVARAIEQAWCPDREGPFGGYDYGYPYDKPVDGGRYVVRDFRDPKSSDWGKWLHQTDNQKEHERVFYEMTRNHIATAAIAIIVERCASDVEAQADIIGAMPGSSIHSALKHAADAIRNTEAHITKGDELLACPFCSSVYVNLFTPVYPLSADCDDALVRCGECDAQGPLFLCDMDDDDAEIHWPNARQAAITAWNTRSQK